MKLPTTQADQAAVLSAAHYDYEKGLTSYAFFKLSDHATGEDLVQETFIKTWKYLVRGGKIDVMKSFLYHILNNLIIDQYRKRKTSSLDLLLEKGYQPAHTQSDPARLMDILDGKAALLLIARLPVRYQKIMRMKYVQELSLAEMSLVTGRSKNSLAVQAHRGLAQLKRIYADQ